MNFRANRLVYRPDLKAKLLNRQRNFSEVYQTYFEIDIMSTSR